MQLLDVFVHLFHPRRSNNHRARILHPDSLFSLSLIIVGFAICVLNIARFSQGLGSVLGYASDISVDQVVVQTNAERAKSGLQQLALNEMLSSAARAKAADMFANQYWAHVSPKGKQPWDFMREAQYRFSSAGENLARDFGTTPEMMAAWMGSPSHRANIMNAKYQEIGVAVVNGNLQGIDTTLVVQMFGKPLQAAAKVSDAAEQTEEKTVAVIATPVPEEEEVVVAVAPDVAAPVVLSDTIAPVGNLQGTDASKAALSPLDLLKVVFMSVLLIMLVALAYDAYVFEQRNTIRLVGKNFGHILFLLVIAAVVFFWKSGAILTLGAAQ